MIDSQEEMLVHQLHVKLKVTCMTIKKKKIKKKYANIFFLNLAKGSQTYVTRMIQVIQHRQTEIGKILLWLE